MSKNYFTKEQALKIALNTNVPFSSDDTQHIFNTAQIREMMNLAVEEAIVRVGTVECADVAEYSTEYWGILHEPVTLGEPLYSVKELEN